jgi:hypothetical protein
MKIRHYDKLYSWTISTKYLLVRIILIFENSFDVEQFDGSTEILDRSKNERGSHTLSSRDCLETIELGDDRTILTLSLTDKMIRIDTYY